MGKLIDLTEQKFGRLTVISRGEKVKHGKPAKWLCKCDCGNELLVDSYSLRSGNTKSCGCLANELSSERMKKRFIGNKYEFYEDYVIGYTNNTGLPFYIDKEDYDKIKNHTWNQNKRGYIVSTNGRIRLHQFVKGKAPKGMIIDHVDRNKANNRKINLEYKTQQDNTKNRSTNKNNKYGVAGVHKSKTKSLPFQATLGANGKIFKKDYATLEEAIIGRLQAEKEYWGDNAPQKHLFKEYGIE